jgi:hypothetical protein
MMSAAPAEDPAAGPVDSLEVRWIVPGQLPPAMLEWFARFPGGTETRQDAYLLQPRLRGLSVKLRDGGALDVKSYLGSPGALDLPRGGHGRLESWRKWSFPSGLPGHGRADPPGWVVVGKCRRSSWFPLASHPDLAQVPPPAAMAGCMAELTEISVRGEAWWSVGFEATGAVRLLRVALSTPPTWYSPGRCRPGCNSARATHSPTRTGCRRHDRTAAVTAYGGPAED